MSRTRYAGTSLRVKYSGPMPTGGGGRFAKQDQWKLLKPFLTTEFRLLSEISAAAKMPRTSITDALAFGQVSGEVEYSARWVKGKGLMSMYRLAAKREPEAGTGTGVAA